MAISRLVVCKWRDCVDAWVDLVSVELTFSYVASPWSHLQRSRPVAMVNCMWPLRFERVLRLVHLEAGLWVDVRENGIGTGVEVASGWLGDVERFSAEDGCEENVW